MEVEAKQIRGDLKMIESAVCDLFIGITLVVLAFGIKNMWLGIIAGFDIGASLVNLIWILRG